MRGTPWEGAMGAHSHVEQQKLHLLKGQQPLVWSLAHLLCQESPLAGAEAVGQTAIHESVAPEVLEQWCTSILVPQESTGRWIREGTGT